MKVGILLIFIYGVLGDFGFGASYLKDCKLCRPWTCINTKLGLEDSLPNKDTYTEVLKNLLPEGAWQGVVDNVLDTCYANKRPRRYTNTCPGQALLHCVVDHLIRYCPEESIRKDDSCASLASLAGFKYMFSQSRYNNLEVNLPHERRPEWFLKNYFSLKCCDVPALFNTTVLSECGFNSIIHYYGHEARKTSATSPNPSFVFVPTETQDPFYTDSTEPAAKQSESHEQDPLTCCDMSDFLPSSSSSECNFHLSWNEQSRLSIDEEPSVSTNTEPPKELKLKYHDIKVVPLSCEQESCVFQQLNVVSENGTVDKDAFSKLLDEFVTEHPNWRSAKARVVTRCLTRSIIGYEADCEINKVLACTFDVLTENCPHTKKTFDPCKHVSAMKNETICLINSSKYFKNRRHYCDFPQIVPHSALTQCQVLSIKRIESAPHHVPQRKHGWMSFKPMCKDTTPSASCLMSKMGVLNKYNFMDYFKIKNRLRTFTTTHQEWSALTDVYSSTLLGMPMYNEHCASQRKLLNILDAMLMTCPVPKRKNTATCNKLFDSMIKKQTQEKHDEILSTTDHNLMTLAPNVNHLDVESKAPELKTMMFPNKRESIFYTPLFLQRNIPKIQIMPIVPTPIRKAPLILTPVYMRSTAILPEPITPESRTEPKGILYSRPFNHDSLFRSSHAPWSVHNQIGNAHTSTTEKPIQNSIEHISPLTLKGDGTF